MSLLDDVRRALQPMSDEGIIVDVEEGPSSATYDSPAARLPSLKPITVIIPGDKRESYRPRIVKLLADAGVVEVFVSIQERSASTRV